MKKGTFLKTKNLILCVAIFFCSFIAKGQSEDYVQLTFKVKSLQEFENGTQKPKRTVYQDLYVIISSDLFVVSNTKNDWDFTESAIIAKQLDGSFNEETGMFMMVVEDIRSKAKVKVVFLADKNSMFIQLPTGKAVSYDVVQVPSEY